MGRSIRVGLAQSLVVPGEVEANIQRALALVAEAAAAGCDAVVLPECHDVGWTDIRARELAQTIPGPSSRAYTAAAAEHGIVIAVGLTERDADAGTVHNSAILIDRDGGIVLKHRKVNELDFARALYEPGTTVAVADTSLGRIALNICADNYGDSLELGRAQIALGAQLLLSPSSWAVSPEHDNEATPYGANWEQPYRELALAGRMPVVGVSNVGPVSTGQWAGWSCIGRSLAVAGDGEVAAVGGYGPDEQQLVVVELELGPGRSRGAEPTDLSRFSRR